MPAEIGIYLTTPADDPPGYRADMCIGRVRPDADGWWVADDRVRRALPAIGRMPWPTRASAVDALRRELLRPVNRGVLVMRSEGAEHGDWTNE